MGAKEPLVKHPSAEGWRHWAGGAEMVLAKSLSTSPSKCRWFVGCYLDYIFYTNVLGQELFSWEQQDPLAELSFNLEFWLHQDTDLAYQNWRVLYSATGFRKEARSGERDDWTDVLVHQTLVRQATALYERYAAYEAALETS